jgi:hypothetical protein
MPTTFTDHQSTKVVMLGCLFGSTVSSSQDREMTITSNGPGLAPHTDSSIASRAKSLGDSRTVSCELALMDRREMEE